MNLVARLPLDRDGVRLRALRRDDVAAFLLYRSDPDVARFQGWSPMDLARARAFIDEQCGLAEVEGGAWRQLAIADARDDALLGDLGVWLSPDRTEAELGITVTPAAQGSGVGRRAVQAAAALLFADTPVQRVHACADARNMACRRMLQAAGFREGAASEVVVKGEPCTEYRYTMARPVAAPLGEPA